MRENADIARQRQMAAEILREHREEVLRRWMVKMSLLAREKGIGDGMDPDLLRQDAADFTDLMISWLEGERPDVDTAAFYHLVLEGRRNRLRLADLSYILLELRTAAKRVIFDSVLGELEAFRVSRLLDDATEAVLRRAADVYELASEADQQAARERLREMSTAWDLEAALAEPQTPAEVCHVASERLREVWPLAACRWRLYETPDGGPKEINEGPDLPVPDVRPDPQHPAGDEQAGGGALGLMEYVHRTKEPYICEDVSRDQRIADATALVQAGVGSLACQPLLVRSRVTGIVLLLGAERGAVAAVDGRKLRELAGVVAFALDRASRLEQSRKRVSEAEVIARIGRSLLELPSQEALTKGVAEALRDFRDYFDVSLFWLDRSAGECVLVAEAGRERLYRPPDYRQKAGEGFIGICAQNGETIRATDLERDERRVIAFEEEHGVHTELAVPVWRGDEVIGVIHVLSDREEDFPESEIAAIEHVAPHIGVALQNARMIAQRDHDRFQLELAHRQLTHIIRSAAVGITGADTQGVYTHWSPSCESLLGYPAGDVIGRRTPLDFAAEPYDLKAVLDECLREGRVTAERAWLHENGTARIIRETAVPLEDEHGYHTGFTSYLVDVTEQKRAEGELRRERDTLQQVVDAMGAGLGLFNASLRLQRANTTLMQWFGLSEADYGKSCCDIYECGRSESQPCPTIIAALGGRPQTRIHEFTDGAGVWHCYEQILTPLEYGETRLVILSLDITEQRRQTEQMRLIGKLSEKVETSLDLERVLHLVLTCVTAGHAIGLNRAFIFLLDEAGACLEGRMAVGPVSAQDARRIWGELAQSQPSIDQLLETTAPSSSDRQLTEVVRSLSVPLSDVENALVSTLRSRTSAHVAQARAAPHLYGRIADVLGLEEFACVPLVAQEEPLGVMLADNKYSRTPIDRYQVELLETFSRQASLAIANARAYEKIEQQLAELRQARDRLIESERMASVGRMAGHLAHEIRNPLTAIGGFATAIGRRHPEDATTRKNAEIISNEVRRLERTLVNVLDYTRPLRPAKAPASVNGIVQDTVNQFRSQLDQAQVQVRLALQEGLPLVVADGQMIKQVIINLVKNALEAMQDLGGGTLNIRTTLEDGKVLVSVTDTGGGIAEEMSETLFSPFATTKIGGIGLGLSVSRRIARQHGGDIVAESAPGKGACFTLSLEAYDQPDTERGNDGEDTAR